MNNNCNKLKCVIPYPRQTETKDQCTVCCHVMQSACREMHDVMSLHITLASYMAHVLQSATHLS
jgi:hypothetical protein